MCIRDRDEVKKVEMDKESEDVIMQNIDQDNEYTTYHIPVSYTHLRSK